MCCVYVILFLQRKRMLLALMKKRKREKEINKTVTGFDVVAEKDKSPQNQCGDRKNVYTLCCCCGGGASTMARSRFHLFSRAKSKPSRAMAG